MRLYRQGLHDIELRGAQFSYRPGRGTGPVKVTAKGNRPLARVVKMGEEDLGPLVKPKNASGVCISRLSHIVSYLCI